MVPSDAVRWRWAAFRRVCARAAPIVTGIQSQALGRHTQGLIDRDGRPDPTVREGA